MLQENFLQVYCRKFMKTNGSQNGSASTYNFSVLRDLRKREGLTIGAVAERSGVSTAVISKLERNQTTAELDTLYKLGRVFGMTASDLVGLAEARLVHKVAATKYDHDGFKFERVSYANTSCFLGTAGKGAKVTRPEIHHDDYEVCWVVEGCIEVEFAAEKQVLYAGQAIQFDAIMHHAYEALEDTKLLIIHLRKENRF